jgi:hypothetical protein
VLARTFLALYVWSARAFVATSQARALPEPQARCWRSCINQHSSARASVVTCPPHNRAVVAFYCCPLFFSPGDVSGRFRIHIDGSVPPFAALVAPNTGTIAAAATFPNDATSATTPAASATATIPFVDDVPAVFSAAVSFEFSAGAPTHGTTATSDGASIASPDRPPLPQLVAAALRDGAATLRVLRIAHCRLATVSPVGPAPQQRSDRVIARRLNMQRGGVAVPLGNSIVDLLRDASTLFGGVEFAQVRFAANEALVASAMLLRDGDVVLVLTLEETVLFAAGC